MARFKTTKKDFIIFKKACLEAIEAYRLRNWKVEFKHELIEGGARAEVWVNGEDETATFLLNPDWNTPDDDEDDEDVHSTPYPVTVKNIKACAKHEVRHLLLAPLTEMLDRYKADKDDVKYYEHVIMDKMEHADNYKLKRGRKK